MSRLPTLGFRSVLRRRPSYCEDLVRGTPVAGDDSGDVAVDPRLSRSLFPSELDRTAAPYVKCQIGIFNATLNCSGNLVSRPPGYGGKTRWRGAVVGLVSQVANEDLRVCPASHRLTLAEGLICWLLSPLPSRTDRSMNSFRRESSACALDC